MTMTRPLPAPLSLSLACFLAAAAGGGCVIQSNANSSGSQNPGTGGAASGGQAGDSAGTPDAGKPRPGVRTSTSTQGRTKTGQVMALKAKKPARDPEDPGVPDHEPLPNLGIDSFVPTAASPGSVVQIFGGGFAKGATVKVGGVAWQVTEVSADRILATVPAAAKSGPIEVALKGAKATTKGEFTVLTDDGGFGKPDKDPVRGLLGAVYPIPADSKELPAFGDLGAPVATIAVDNLDVATRNFEQGFPGVSGGLVEWFGIHFQGSLNVTEAGEYELCILSDDGAILFLDGTTVVDIDGLHSATEKCELVYMDPGEYKVDLLYFQGPRFEIALQWTWAKDGGAKAAVPAQNLFVPAEAAALGGK